MRSIKIAITFFFASMCYTILSAQEAKVKISGKIQDRSREPIEVATIYLQGSKISCVSGQKGEYTLEVSPGTYTLVCSSLGFETFTERITVSAGDDVKKNIILKSVSKDLDEVIVFGKSQVKEVKESAYNVAALDAKPFYNTTMDISNALDRMSGVKIRALGGLGSENQISLNGYTGRYVKVFMDGMPMEGAGSSFRVNNIPLNLADRIEVYKGVVPIEFGADAIGGAINIVTRKNIGTYVDASYSYGSFNTHKSNVNAGFMAKSGFTVSLNAYQNYSDNDYKVKTSYLILEGEGAGTYSTEEKWFRRFHDRYRNEGVMLKTGVVNKSWADQLLVGFRYSQEDVQIQHSSIMRIVFGGRKRDAKAISPSISYVKKNLLIEHLDFSLNAEYNKVRNHNIDTLARRYSWSGEYDTTSSQGEGQGTLSKYDNKNGTMSANLSYKIANKHFISANDMLTRYERKAVDPLSTTGSTLASYYMKRTNLKNVFGASYKFAPSRKWNALAFFKQYNTRMRGPIETNTGYETQTKKSNTTGFGVAGTYIFFDKLQLKTSFEKTFRLPTDRELFGDEVSETGNAGLKPENSRNINANISYEGVFNKQHTVYVEIGLIYRDTRDYIRRVIQNSATNGTGYSTNHGRVKTLGIEAEARYFYKRTFSVGGNITLQNIRNMEQYNATGQKLIYYKDRMPNMPYSFGNVDIAYYFKNLFTGGDNLSLNYNLNYVHSFFRGWKSAAGTGTNIVIPEQLSHDFSVTYSLKNGRYNISAEVRNLTDELMYDNYSLQKPGRSFAAKFRYFFFK